MRQSFGQEALARQTGGAYRTLDRRGCSFDFNEDVHRGIPLDPHRRAAQAVFRDLAIDAQRHLVAEALEDYARRIRRIDTDLVLLAMLVTFADANRPLPSYDAERRLPTAGPVDPQPQDFVTRFQLAAAVIALVDHRTPKHELGTGLDESGLERLRIFDPRFQLELVHENRASSTARVSPRFSNTCVAPAARSAWVS